LQKIVFAVDERGCEIYVELLGNYVRCSTAYQATNRLKNEVIQQTFRISAPTLQ
jgi:hypothetical protein